MSAKKQKFFQILFVIFNPDYNCSVWYILVEDLIEKAITVDNRARCNMTMKTEPIPWIFTVIFEDDKAYVYVKIYCCFYNAVLDRKNNKLIVINCTWIYVRTFTLRGSKQSLINLLKIVSQLINTKTVRRCCWTAAIRVKE